MSEPADSRSLGRVLVVEDESIVAVDLSVQLTNLGYDVVDRVASGEEAVAIALSAKPDVVLMDIRLRGAMDGIQAAAEIRRQRDMPVIYLTAYSDDDTLQRAKLAEPSGYLLKPVDERSLQTAIALALYKHEMERKLRESEERFRTAFQHAALGMAILGTDGRYTQVNRALCGFLGYSEEELLQRTYHDVTLSADLPASEAAFAAMLAGERDYTWHEKRYVQKDGQPVWAMVSNAVVRDPAAQPLYIVSEIQNIDARKRAEAAVRETEFKFRQLVEQASDAIFISDRHGRILHANPRACEMLGYTETELLGMTMGETYPRNEEDLVQRRLNGLAIGQTLQFERNMRRRDGRLVPVEVSLKAVNEEWMQGIARDISERKHREEELRESREQLRRLVAETENIQENERTRIAREVHDELGGALTALKLDLSWLTRQVTGTGSAASPGAVLDRAGSMARLLDQTIASIRRISTDLRPGILDDLGLVPAMEWQAQSFQERTGVTCSLTVNPRDIELDRGTSTAFFRIMQEIMTNIARHAGATHVEVHLTRHANVVELEVVDNGIGITEAQIKSKTSMGLLGIRERVRLMKGTALFSRMQGRGTRVSVCVPVAATVIGGKEI